MFPDQILARKNKKTSGLAAKIRKQSSWHMHGPGWGAKQAETQVLAIRLRSGQNDSFTAIWPDGVVTTANEKPRPCARGFSQLLF
jgi:hypothetical protein